MWASWPRRAVREGRPQGDRGRLPASNLSATPEVGGSLLKQAVAGGKEQTMRWADRTSPKGTSLRHAAPGRRRTRGGAPGDSPLLALRAGEGCRAGGGRPRIAIRGLGVCERGMNAAARAEAGFGGYRNGRESSVSAGSGTSMAAQSRGQGTGPERYRSVLLCAAACRFSAATGETPVPQMLERYAALLRSS
jgi:hypothetical protein